MSNIDKRELRKAAMHAKTTDDWGCDADNFHDKATPDAVLALLDELEAKDKQIDDLKATAAHSNAGWKEAHEQESRAEAAEKRIAELSRHLQCAHAFIEHTEAFGHAASNGILCCGDAQWNIDASKLVLAAAGKGE